jgi:nucleoside-diphosphate-sugar epimerase
MALAPRVARQGHSSTSLTSFNSENAMRVLMTGHNGYIGTVMCRIFRDAGHEVTGLDTFLFEGCTFGPDTDSPPSIRVDLRDVSVEQVAGYDAVVHLAALCNDPLGNLNSHCTEEINHQAAVRLARLAKRAGVGRYLFASSCSLYGVAGDEMLDEDAAFNPITPYGATKVLVEQDVSQLADERFSPTFLRNATAYGYSPRLRADLVVNNLLGFAYTTGEVMIQSDGTPWRPLVHVEDIARAFLAVLHAPRELVHNEAFNVGQTGENYRVRDLAAMVQDVVPGSRIEFAPGGGPDPRCYRVRCDKIAANLPEFRPKWTVRSGIEQLFEQYRTFGLTREEFVGNRYLRIKQIQDLQRAGRIDSELRWVGATSATYSEPAEHRVAVA